MNFLKIFQIEKISHFFTILTKLIKLIMIKLQQI